jgi:hypothetical protein
MPRGYPYDYAYASYPSDDYADCGGGYASVGYGWRDGYRFRGGRS